jgi:predicted Zn-dependent protease
MAQARELFRKGLALQPQNISIALNLAQALLPGKGEAQDLTKLKECQDCLRMVGKMPHTDPRFERFQKLQIRAFGA